jgi:hypothetical protein
VTLIGSVRALLATTFSVAVCVAFGASPARAQGSCFVNNQASCSVPATPDATHAINLTVTAATRLSVATTSIALPAVTAVQFDTLYGPSVGTGLIIRSNTNWSVTIQASSLTWTGVGPLARTDRPATDLQWSLASASGFSDVSTSPVALTNGAATGGESVTMFLRGRFTWLLDTPGSYTLPIQLTITAP